MRKLSIIILSFFLLSCQAQEEKKSQSKATSILKIVKYEELHEVITKNDDKLYVINFWATWCKPCVEELPEFMEVNDEYSTNSNFKMILVSLDIAKQLNTKVKSFIDKNNISADVYLLDDTKRMNEWIPFFDESWTGALPATLFYKNGKKVAFIEKQLPKSELQKIIKENL